MADVAPLPGPQVGVRGFRLVVCAAYALGIAALSTMPARDLLRLGLSREVLDLVHVPLFAGLTLATLWALVGPALVRTALVGLGALAFAALDEWHQTSVPGRVASLSDLRANALGIGLGIAIYSAVGALRHRRQRS